MLDPHDVRAFALLLVACTSSIESSTPGTDAPVDPDPKSDATSLPAYEVTAKFGHDLIRSVTVHKNGGEDRIVYVENARIAQYPSTGVLPDDTRLIMEVTGGGCFVIEKTGGTWLYGSFGCNSNPAVFTTQANTGCSNCHNGAAEPGVFTSPSLRRLVATHVGEEIVCPAGPGPTPCAATVYE